jgi:hypothetical protein
MLSSSAVFFPSVISVLSVVQFGFISTSAISGRNPPGVATQSLSLSAEPGHGAILVDEKCGEVFEGLHRNLRQRHEKSHFSAGDIQQSAGQGRHEREKRKSNPSFIVSSQSPAGHVGIRRWSPR